MCVSSLLIRPKITENSEKITSFISPLLNIFYSFTNNKVKATVKKCKYQV